MQTKLQMTRTARTDMDSLAITNELERSATPSFFLPFKSKEDRSLLSRLEVTTPLATTTLSQEVSLSQILWDRCVAFDLPNLALKCQFIQGIKSGKLDPVKYAGYFIQDAVYCVKAVDGYQNALRRTLFMLKFLSNQIPPKTDDFIGERLKKYQDYAGPILEEWHIADCNAVKLGKAADDYIKFEADIMITTANPLYLLVASLPCLRLWYWLATTLKPEMSEDNLYYSWVTENSSHRSLDLVESFINNNASYIDLELAAIIYQNAMMGECNFFRSACGESISELDDLCKRSPAPEKDTLSSTASPYLEEENVTELVPNF
jgi:thiaminase